MQVQITLEIKDKITNPGQKVAPFTVIRGGLFDSKAKENNWAFIDGQNFYQGIKEKGWKIGWFKFKTYLREELQVTKAVIFLGWREDCQWFYSILKKAGFEIEFRETKRLKDGTIDGGNVDADLAGFMLDHKREYSKAVVIADDADYCKTLQSLNAQDKLKVVISSHPLQSTSLTLKKKIGTEKIISIHDVRKKIELVKQIHQAS